MDDTLFDHSLIRSALALAGSDGWPAVTVARAARAAGLPLPRARARFPTRGTILARFGRMADEAALADIASEGPARDRLFDMLMRRIDIHQEHRDGVIAVLDAARTDPGLGLFLAMSAGNSLRWMLDGAGIESRGWRGAARLHGLVAVWLMTLRAWRNDTSPDLSATMRALDENLDKADRAEAWMGGSRATPRPEDPLTDPTAESAPEPPPTPVIEPEPGLDEPSGLQPSPGAPPPPPDVPEAPVG